MTLALILLLIVAALVPLRAPHGVAGLFGLFEGSGNSSSSSATTTTTTNIDRRVAAGESSIITGDNATLTLTDSGSVQAAFSFARDTLSGALGQIENATDHVAQSEKAIAAAYETAKAGEQRILVGLGIASVAVVALAALKGFKRG